MSQAKNPILWSFNPFQNDPQVLKNVVALLKLLAKQSGKAVEPVFVVSPAEANIVLEFSVPAKERFEKVARLESEKFLKKLAIPGLLPPTILVENQLKLSASAKALANYAQKSEAYAILVGTHGKSGLGRVLLGSFAETLLYQAKTPVLLVNRHLKPPKALRHFLFASDFSKESKNVFEKFCVFLQPLRAAVTVYHSVPKPFSWATAAAKYLLKSRTLSQAQYLREVAKETSQKGEDFKLIAGANGVPCKVVLGADSADTGTSILRKARRLKVDAVGLANQTGRWETALLGSASRGLLREGRFLIWILRVG